MATVDKLLQSNKEYARQFKLGHLPMPREEKWRYWLVWMPG